MTNHVKHSADLKVLMVSTSYPADLTDWRGLFIRHLSEAIARRRDINLQLWSPPGKVPERATLITTGPESEWLASLMAKGGIAHLMRTQSVRGLVASMKLIGMLWRLYRRDSTVGLYHVNWLQNALPLPRDGRPLLVTVLGTDMQLLKLPGMNFGLRRVFAGRRVAICPNAEWMVPQLQRRFGDLATIRFVPFGIAPNWFEVQRSPATPLRWLCVSRLTRGKLGSLFDWCAPHFSDGRRELHLLGPMQQPTNLPNWVHYHGAATPEALCKHWFPSAQGLITLSQHAEGRPQVLLEAMASGLPIIASRLPAHIDLIRDGENGKICDGADEVGRALDCLEEKATNAAMGPRAREWVRTEIGTWDDCAARYVAIYRNLLDVSS